MKHKQIQRDYGKDLFDTVVILVILLGILWYMKV